MPVNCPRQLLEQKYRLLKIKEQRRTDCKLDYFKPYDWQAEFCAMTKTKRELMIMAGNQCGKTDETTSTFACWLTNYYPPWFNGYRFTYPIIAYALGVDIEQIYNVLQTKLLGKMDDSGRFSGGWIPAQFIPTDKQYIHWVTSKKGHVKHIKIRTVNGGWSELHFFSYEQGQGTLMGNKVDAVLVDEQPRDPLIAPQLLQRTSNGARGTGGIIMYSMTPEYGETVLTKQFMHELKPHQYFKRVTWWDCPHWTEEKIRRFLASTPAYLRDLKSKGIPISGSGMVYPFNEDDIKGYLAIDEVPSHFKWLGAIDFGIRTGALVVGVVDPDTQDVHVVDAVRTDEWGTNRIANKMLSYGDIPWAWPHDGHQIKENSGAGLTQVQQLVDMGVKMLPTHAQVILTLPNGKEKKSTSVEAGIQIVYNLLEGAKMHVNGALFDFFKELRFYAREKGQIKHQVDEQGVKVGDHIMDAWRYFAVMLSHARVKGAVRKFELTGQYTSKRI